MADTADAASTSTSASSSAASESLSSNAQSQRFLFPEGSFVFIPDKMHCFIPAKSLRTFEQGQEGLIYFLPLNGGYLPDESKAKRFVIQSQDTLGILPMDPQSLSPISNMVELKQLNDASILHNLRMRFLSDEIYSQIGTILVSLNPFKLLPIYTPQIMEKYLRNGSRNNPPHVYGVADNAYKQMIERHLNQSCIVSGESGAGKTEATKLFLGYIAEASTQGDDETGVGSIQQQILEANPLMEAFGNAKTSRNDNSSRFGKWISITFNNKRGNIIGASITQYLLEKSRVVSHSSGERNYHIFYQLCAAATMDQNIARTYKIKNTEAYYYLNHNPVEVYTVPGTDDYKEWEHTIQAMNVIGIPPEKQDDVIRTVAGVLHLGNVRFEKIEVPGKDARAGIVNPDTVALVAEQLGSTLEQLTQALTKKNVSVGKDVVYSEYSVEAAKDARDALAKTLFGKMFEWLTAKINESLVSGAMVAGKSISDENKTIIGVLDIFGFESFEHNSFEQLCINYCNEKLQGFFNDHIFKLEQAEYEAENVDVKKIGFVDNQAVLDAIELKPSGILAQLDEELITPRGSDDGFLKKIFSTGKSVANTNGPRPGIPSTGAKKPPGVPSTASAPANKAGVPAASNAATSASNGALEIIKKPEMKLLREKPALAQCFIVVHYAGEVAYNVTGFLTKNKDSLIDDLEQIGNKSSVQFVRDLFALVPSNTSDDTGINESSGRPTVTSSRKTNVGNSGGGGGGKRTLGSQFKDQLTSLMKTLRSTEPHFIRCVKSNPEKRGGIFSAQMVLDQLRYSGLMEVTRIRKLGYPVRKTFSEFVDRYAPLFPGQSRTGELEPLVDHLKKINLLTGDDWQVGKTKLFLRQGMFNGLELAREKIFGEAVIKIQKIARGYIARFRFKKYTKILNELKMSMAQNNEEKLEGSLLAVGELPHNGRHLPVVDEAKKLLDKLQAERKVLGLVKEAVAARDLAQLESSTEAAIELGIGALKEVKAALQLLDIIRKERMVRDALRTAMESSSILSSSSSAPAALQKLEAAIQQAEKFGLLKLPEAIVAMSKRDRMLAEERELSALQKAIDENKIDAMNERVSNLVNMGLDYHALVAQAMKITKKHAQESAERARQVAHVERELHEATRSRNLNLLNAIYPEIIRLGMTGPTVKSALLLRDQLIFEKDAFEHIDAEMKTARVKADSYNGITRHDLAPLTKAITKVKAKGLTDHPKLAEAVEFQTRMVKQLVVQEQLKQALRDKNPQGLKKAAEKATALGMQTNLAKMVFAEVRNIQKQRLAPPPERKRSIDTGAAPKIGLLGSKDNKITKSASKAHLERITKAQSDIYQFSNFFEIRSDEDYTQYDIAMMKKHKAELKLKYQKTPISRSILAGDQEFSQSAIRNHRSLLGWCGDSNATFRSTLAHDILMRGIEHPEMIDEIYVQICKHLIDNPRKESMESAWLLMAMATRTLVPTANFVLYLLNFLLSHQKNQGVFGNFARLCIHQLDGTIEHGPSWKSPTLEGVQLYELRPPVLALIHMVDNTTIEFPVSPDMTVQQVVEAIASTQNLSPIEAPKMGIFVTPREFVSSDEKKNANNQQGLDDLLRGGADGSDNSYSASDGKSKAGNEDSLNAVDSLLAAVKSRPTVVGVGSLRNTVAPSSMRSGGSGSSASASSSSKSNVKNNIDEEGFDDEDDIDNVVPRRTVVGAHSMGNAHDIAKSPASIIASVVGPNAVQRQGTEGGEAHEASGGGDGEIRIPPAPRTPWPLPGMVYMGDIYTRMSSQGREPIFSFKKKLFFPPKDDGKPDKLLYYQLVQDVVSGALPVNDEAQVIGLVACSIAAKMGKLPDDPNKLIEEDLMSFIPLHWYEKKTEISWAKSVLAVADVMAEHGASQLREKYIKNCQSNPLYGMSLFYGYRDINEADCIFGINYKGVHFIHPETFEITTTIPYAAIQKFGASPTCLWLQVVSKKIASVLNIYTLQTAEAFGLIHDYTHWAITKQKIAQAVAAAATSRRTSFLTTAAAAVTNKLSRRTSVEPKQGNQPSHT